MSWSNGAMLNQKPIFAVGFQRGGTNILLNLLLSHPEVCMPRGETQFVFRGRRKTEPWIAHFTKLWTYLPILISQRQDVFAISLWEPRREFTPRTMRTIDRVLFRSKLDALEPRQNLYKTENVKYAPQEISASRLLCKNLNGLIFLTDEFYRMYPDATFIGLVRNGLALCEGHIRRGADPVRIASRYEKGCQKMIDDSNRMRSFHLIRFEDLINQPMDSLRRIYEWVGLDIGLVRKIRLETKQVLTEEGRHEFVHGTGQRELVWYDLEDFGRHFRRDVNKNQMRRLTDGQKQVILELAYSSLQHFGYT